MKYLLTVALVLTLFLTALGPALAAPSPGPGFGKHISCMATDCIDMVKEMHGTFGKHVSELARGTAMCGCDHMGDGMGGQCSCGCMH